MFWDALVFYPGVEVFVFHWGCTPLGALGDDHRGQNAWAHGGAEPLLPPLDNFSGTSRADLFLRMGHFVPGLEVQYFITTLPACR